MNIQIRPYDLGCEPSPSIPAETLMESAEGTYLLFFAVSKRVDPTTGYLQDLGVAIVECKECAMTRFGYPNDEGWPEHEIYDVAPNPESSILEVVGSQWVNQVGDQMHRSTLRIWGRRNADVSQPSEAGLRHFVIPLKEKTFECLASSLAVRAYTQTFEDAFAWVTAKFMTAR